MNTFIVIVLIVVFVFSILQIILFFKLWRMTNNVRAIAKKYTATKPEVNTEERNYMWGIIAATLESDPNRAAEILTGTYVDRLKYIHDVYDFRVFPKHVEKLRVDFKKYYGIIGQPFPEQFDRITTKEDIKQLLKS